MNPKNSIKFRHKATFYLGLRECFDCRSPRERTGHILCYSFFTDDRFTACLSGIVLTDRTPKIRGKRLPEVMDEVIDKALMHMNGTEWGSAYCLNGLVYSPSYRTTLHAKDPKSGITPIPVEELKRFSDAIDKCVMTVRD